MGERRERKEAHAETRRRGGTATENGLSSPLYDGLENPSPVWSDILIPDALEKVRIGKQNQIQSSEMLLHGRFPVIDQGQDYIAGYCNDESRVIRDELPLVIFGDHTRCVKYVDFPFVLGADGTKVLKPKTELLDTKFFYYALRNLGIPNRGYNRHFTVLKEKCIPVPPLATQREIAAILGQVQKAIEEQERLLALTAELKRTLLHRLFTQGLRGEPRKQTEIGPVPESWEVVPCDRLCEMITVGVVVRPTKHYVVKGVPAFRSFNVREDRLVPNNLVYFSEKSNDTVLAKSKLRAGDVLVVRTGYPGTSCVVPKEFDSANCIDLVILRPKPRLINYGYLSRFFNAPEGKRQSLSGKHGLAQQHLNVGAVKRTLIPVPALAEQVEIDFALATVQQKLLNIEKRHATLSDLFHTLLHQLMMGQTRCG